MRYKTDLDAVKHVAVSLLHTHINETKFSPMVVQHPFTSSGFVGISNNGEMELLNILESSESKVKEIAELSRQSLVISELMKKGIQLLNVKK